MLRSELTKQGLDHSIHTTTEFANNLRKQHGASYLAEKLLEKMQREAPKNAVFEAIRHPAELATLRRLPGFLLISVDAPREMRYERIKQRGRGDNLGSYEAFCEIEDQQLSGSGTDMQMAAVINMADISVVNIGNLEELKSQIDESLGV